MDSKIRWEADSHEYSSVPPLPDPSLYDKDFYAWLFETAVLLRLGRYTEVAVAHVVEEPEDLGKRERRTVENHIRNVVLH